MRMPQNWLIYLHMSSHKLTCTDLDFLYFMQTCFHTHAQIYIHTYTICQSHVTGMVRCRQIYKSLSPSLSLVELGFYPTYTLSLSGETEMLQYMAAWMDSERPAGRKEVMKGWTGQTSLQSLLCEGAAADSSAQDLQCVLLCQFLIWVNSRTLFPSQQSLSTSV